MHSIINLARFIFNQLIILTKKNTIHLVVVYYQRSAFSTLIETDIEISGSSFPVARETTILGATDPELFYTTLLCMHNLSMLHDNYKTRLCKTENS